jgi:hypothetical protein
MAAPFGDVRFTPESGHSAGHKSTMSNDSDAVVSEPADSGRLAELDPAVAPAPCRSPIGDSLCRRIRGIQRRLAGRTHGNARTGPALCRSLRYFAQRSEPRQAECSRDWARQQSQKEYPETVQPRSSENLLGRQTVLVCADDFHEAAFPIVDCDHQLFLARRAGKTKLIL